MCDGYANDCAASRLEQSKGRNHQRRPAGQERNAAERRDRAEHRHARDGEQIQTALSQRGERVSEKRPSVNQREERPARISAPQGGWALIFPIVWKAPRVAIE